MKENLEETLRALGRDVEAGPDVEPGARPGPHPGPHPESEQLAAWLDGVAPVEQAERVEAHLAACRECRALAADVASWQAGGARLIEDGDATAEGTPARASLPPTPPSRLNGADGGPGRLHRRRLLAPLAAAALLLIAFGAWCLASWDGRLAALGVPLAAAFTEPSRVVELRAALEGDWPRPAFGDFAGAAGELVLRGAEAPRTPRPLEPRWSAVRSGRPMIRLSGVGEPLRVLIVDADERIVTTFEAPAGGGELELTWPAELPPLGAGVYAWKVRVENLDVAASSAWVPFRVISSAEASALDRRLDGLGDFEAAVRLAEAGLFEEARGRLGAIDDALLRRQLIAGLDRSRAER